MIPPQPTPTSPALAAGTWAPNAGRDPAWTCPAVPPDVRAFHRSLADHAATALTELPGLARELEVAHVFAKDESNRLGLPAFKGLGASWAIHCALRDRIGSRSGGDRVTIVTATDGNHGRAVARFARRFGHRAHIFVPDGVHPAAVQAIRDEGGDVRHVTGTYDEAVQAAAYSAQDDDRVLVQDTAWVGYEDVPGWIVDGYSTLFAEMDEQLREYGIARPDLVIVPTGVGSLLQAALAHYRSDPDLLGTAIVSVEPIDAACVHASVTAGRPVAVDTGRTLMAGLNCGTVSTLAWPYIAGGLDACVTVTDAQAADAARDLAALGVPAGPCGAAPLAAARTIVADPRGSAADRARSMIGLSPTASVVLLVTEGAAANPGLLGTEDAD